MRRLFDRLFGSKAAARDYSRGPQLAGLDPISARAIALQKAYWQSNPDELRELETRAEPSWAERLRLHHLRCLAWLDADEGRLRRALLAPAGERPSGDSSEADAAARDRVLASAKQLLARRSPYRPRHAFAWLGDGPPEGDAIPYSDFQGRTISASLTHLGALEVVTLDDRHEPAGIEFVPFDELLTSTAAPREPGEIQPPFRPARVLREYGLPEQIVLLPLRHGLSWLAHEPGLLRGTGVEGEHEVARVAIPELAGARSLALRAGLQRFETLSDHAHEGLGSFRLADCYQLSLAIDDDDPRFADKCRGRGIDPEATRGDVVRESRLRASAKARKTTLS
ncbi:hypothetical protein ACNOYE_24490 [Nannocystaceae bacterium ST9]